jgi:hypothetical protein
MTLHLNQMLGVLLPCTVALACILFIALLAAAAACRLFQTGLELWHQHIASICLEAGMKAGTYCLSAMSGMGACSGMIAALAAPTVRGSSKVPSPSSSSKMTSVKWQLENAANSASTQAC